MKRQNRIVFISATLMLVLVLDCRTVVQGAREGIQLCLQSVIPALFPFFVISSFLTSYLLGLSVPGLHWVGRLCHIPPGAESLFLLGILGGYPVGAKCVTQCCQSGLISRSDARRLLGFCSNCGPSFIFGICSTLFTRPVVPLLLWLIQLLSAMIVGVILPASHHFEKTNIRNTTMTVTGAIKGSVKSMSEVCGWVIVFRVIISLLRKWLFWLLPEYLCVGISGLLELTNGCMLLTEIASESLRFVTCCILLSFGGLCVVMQTASVSGECGLGYYLPGKILQSLFSSILAMIAASVIFKEAAPYLPWIGAAIVTVLIIFSHRIIKKDSIRQKSVV